MEAGNRGFHSNDNSENSKSPLVENSMHKQLQIVAHAIINKHPVRVEQLTSLTITKEIDSFAYQLIETLKTELTNASKGKPLDPKAHVFNPQGRHVGQESGFDAYAVYAGDNAVSYYLADVSPAMQISSTLRPGFQVNVVNFRCQI